MSAQLLPRALRSTDWRLIGLLCAAAAVTLPFGAYVLVHVDPEGLRRGIGLVVLVWALAMFVGVRYAVGCRRGQRSPSAARAAR